MPGGHLRKGVIGPILGGGDVSPSVHLFPQGVICATQAWRERRSDDGCSFEEVLMKDEGAYGLLFGVDSSRLT